MLTTLCVLGFAYLSVRIKAPWYAWVVLIGGGLRDPVRFRLGRVLLLRRRARIECYGPHGLLWPRNRRGDARLAFLGGAGLESQIAPNWAGGTYPRCV